MVEVMIVFVLVLAVAVDTSVYGQTIVRNGTTSTPTLLWTSSQIQGSIAVGRTTVPAYNNRTTVTRTVSLDRNTDVKTRTTRGFVSLVQSTKRSTLRLISTDSSPLFTRTAKSSTSKVLNSTTTLTKFSTPQSHSTSIRSIIGRQSTDFGRTTAKPSTTKVLESTKILTESSTPLKTTRRRYTTNLSRRSTKIQTTNIVNQTSTPLDQISTIIDLSRTARTTEVSRTSTSAPASTTPLNPTRMIPNLYVWNIANRHIYPNPRTEPRRCRRKSQSWACDPSGVFTTEKVDELNDILTSISVESKCPCSEHCHHRKFGFLVTLAILYRYDPHPNETEPMARHLRMSELRAGTCGEDTVVTFDFSRKLLNISTGLVAFQTLTDQLAKKLMDPFIEDIRSQDVERNFVGLKEFLSVAKTVFIGTYNPPAMTDLERLFIAIGGSAALMVLCSLFFCCIVGSKAFWGRSKKRNPNSLDVDDEEDKYYDPRVEGTLIPFYHFVPEGTVGNKKRMGIIEMNNKMKMAKVNRNLSTQEEDPEVYDDFDRFAKVGRAARLWRMRARAARKPPPKPPPPAVGNFRRSQTT